MHKNIASLKAAAVAAALFCAMPHGAMAAPSNEEITKRHFAALVSGAHPQLAELTMFFTMMPKGGDLHHHYSGALYAEQYVDFLDKQGLCVNKTSYRIETDPNLIAAEQALPAAQRNCLSSKEV